MGYDSFWVAATKPVSVLRGYNSVNIDGVDKEGNQIAGYRKQLDKNDSLLIES
jgi:hypothetical protein